ncbi:MAG: hypothetical protein AB1540_13435 [Bdellovibrionota bacterium]
MKFFSAMAAVFSALIFGANFTLADTPNGVQNTQPASPSTKSRDARNGSAPAGPQATQTGTAPSAPQDPQKILETLQEKLVDFEISLGDETNVTFKEITITDGDTPNDSNFRLSVTDNDGYVKQIVELDGVTLENADEKLFDARKLLVAEITAIRQRIERGEFLLREDATSIESGKSIQSGNNFRLGMPFVVSVWKQLPGVKGSALYAFPVYWMRSRLYMAAALKGPGGSGSTEAVGVARAELTVFTLDFNSNTYPIVIEGLKARAAVRNDPELGLAWRGDIDVLGGTLGLEPFSNKSDLVRTFANYTFRLGFRVLEKENARFWGSLGQKGKLGVILDNRVIIAGRANFETDFHDNRLFALGAEVGYRINERLGISVGADHNFISNAAHIDEFELEQRPGWNFFVNFYWRFDAIPGSEPKPLNYDEVNCFAEGCP